MAGTRRRKMRGGDERNRNRARLEGYTKKQNQEAALVRALTRRDYKTAGLKKERALEVAQAAVKDIEKFANEQKTIIDEEHTRLKHEPTRRGWFW